jgi:hypothetical protein
LAQHVIEQALDYEKNVPVSMRDFIDMESIAADGCIDGWQQDEMDNAQYASWSTVSSLA